VLSLLLLFFRIYKSLPCFTDLKFYLSLLSCQTRHRLTFYPQILILKQVVKEATHESGQKYIQLKN
jgi:hypothetical protein